MLHVCLLSWPLACYMSACLYPACSEAKCHSPACAYGRLHYMWLLDCLHSRLTCSLLHCILASQMLTSFISPLPYMPVPAFLLSAAEGQLASSRQLWRPAVRAYLFAGSQGPPQEEDHALGVDAFELLELQSLPNRAHDGRGQAVREALPHSCRCVHWGRQWSFLLTQMMLKDRHQNSNMDASSSCRPQYSSGQAVRKLLPDSCRWCMRSGNQGHCLLTFDVKICCIQKPPNRPSHA